MSEQVNRNREFLRKWIEVVNTRDWSKIKPALQEMYAKNYVLHDPSLPNQMQTFDEFAKGLEHDLPGWKNLKVTLEDCFGEEDKLATRAILEFEDPSSNEKTKVQFIIITRFEDGKFAEEWQVTAPVN